MSQASDFLEGEILDHFLGRDAGYTAAATLYIALYTAAPSDAGGGTEVSGGSYARAAVTNDNTNWQLSGGVISNLNVITYAAATADWGTVTHFGILDASSGGNLLFHGALTASANVTNGSTYRIAVGNITVNYAAKSNYLRDEILELIFGISGFTAPATVYCRLYTSAPTDAGGGTEVSGGSYSPVSITNDNTEWSRSAGLAQNINAIQFAAATASWGTVTSAALWDASSGGNLICWANLTSAQTVNNGSTFAFNAGSFRVSLD